MTNEQKERANAVFDKLIDQKPYLADHINDQRNEFMSQKIGSNSKTHLQQIVANVINLEDRKAEINDEIKEIFKESKSAGFDNKILKKLIRAAKDPEKFKAELEMLEIYSDDAQLNLFK
jgi:uncharacterized protein (UPF0335 family)